MKRRLVIIAAIVLAVPIAASIAISLVLATATAQVRVAAAVSRALRRPVGFTSVSLRPFPIPSLRVRQLEIAESAGFGTAPLLRIDRADLRPRLAPLLRGRLELASIILKRPAVTVIRDAEGRLNVASPGAAAEAEHKTQSTGPVATGERAALLRGVRVRVENGNVTYIRRRKDGSAAEFRLEDVDLTLTGDTRIAFEGKGRLQPGDLTLDITDGSVELNGAPRLADAAVTARVSLDGDDVTDLFAALLGPKVGIGGSLKGALQVGGTLATPTARGPLGLSNASLVLTHPRCPEPKRRRLLLPLVSTTAEWSAGRLTGYPTIAEIGDGQIRANLSIALDGRTRVEVNDLTATAVPLESVLVDFMCGGHAVTGALDLEGRMAIRPAGSSYPLSGWGRIRVGKGKVVGPKALALMSAVLRVGGAVSALLSADLPRSLVSSPLDFDSLTANYGITDGVLSFADLSYASRAMTITGEGQVQLATGQLDVDLVVNHGRGLAHAKVTGPAESPSVRVIPSTILREVDPRGVARGVEALIQRLR